MGKQSKQSHKQGRNKRKPAFMRYKASNRLEKRKVRNLMRSNGMTEAQAMAFRHRQMQSTA